MRDDFAVMILTHGRADNIRTLKALKKGGYTGKIYIVIDNEDETADEYYKRFGDKVVMFDKIEAAKKYDAGENFGNRCCIMYARNESFDIAKSLGLKYFMQLDDDFNSFDLRYEEDGKLKGIPCRDLDRLFEGMVEFLETSGAITVALAQGGDMIGGLEGGNFKKGLIRKAMNTFFCSVDRKFDWFGTQNEDVSTYCLRGSRGELFLTVTHAMIIPVATQAGKGGMSETYLENGTYLKSFYSVMYMPSAVKVGVMNTSHSRIHHKVSWENTAPKILNEKYKKGANYGHDN